MKGPATRLSLGALPLAPLALAMALTAALTAQVQNVIVPKKYTTNGTREQQAPFAMQPLRFQQLYEAKELQVDLPVPVRFKGVRFRAKQTGNQGKTVDVQLMIGTYTGFGSSTFDQNLGNGRVVFPRQTITLPTSTAGAWVVDMPFTTDFHWDRTSNVCLDIRIYSNGNNSQPFLYFFDSFINDPFVGITHQWAIGPNATSSTTRQGGSGLVTRFDYANGVALPYGDGCKGLGDFVPAIGTNGLPIIGNTALRCTISQARPQVPAVLLWGFSRTQWGALPLPLDLRPIGMPDCTLHADIVFLDATMTQGGSAGNGIGSVPFGIPAASIFQGISIYAQWLVSDDSQNRTLPFSMSDAIMLVIG